MRNMCSAAVGFRSDISLHTPWWHRLAVVLFPLSLVAMAAITLILSSELIRPQPTLRNVPHVRLSNFGKATSPHVPNTRLAGAAPAARQPRSIPQFGLHEVTLEAAGRYSNPYVEAAAEASLIGPDGRSRALPLFWDGAATWRFRFSPDLAGEWRWTVGSRDPGLDGQSGRFVVAPARRSGGIRPMRGHPAHFERQGGSPFWFFGDTAWAFFTDSGEERHDRDAAFRYADARVAQGFNVIHSMVLSEAGWANRGGAPFTDISAERLNPGYWQEIDARIAYANSKGLVCGLAIAWGDKRRQEPYAWRRFPTLEARERYARYAAARYGAYDVYFLVSGEWHGEVRTRPAPEADVKREFMHIGRVLAAADPHDRMIAIHPMADHGSVREFSGASWMAFGDYQQNYRDLHARALLSRRSSKPVVNSEYGYYLRDQNGDGVPDKDNSTSLESMRHATWDIVMAGAYVVTGFGTTYFGGHRDPGPFDVDASKNTEWEKQIGVLARLFTSLEWWKLEPHDELLRSSAPRGPDTRQLQRLAPPAAAYWALAEPGRQYVVYVRGLQVPITVALPAGAGLRARQFDPRTGAFTDLSAAPARGGFVYRPPDRQDWVVLLNAAQPVSNLPAAAEREELHLRAGELTPQRVVAALRRVNHLRFQRADVVPHLAQRRVRRPGQRRIERRHRGDHPVHRLGAGKLRAGGVTGFLHEPEDIAGMAKSGLALLTDAGRHRSFAQAARRTAAERFCADLVVPRYEAFYEKLLSRNGAHGMLSQDTTTRRHDDTKQLVERTAFSSRRPTIPAFVAGYSPVVARG